MQIIWSVVGLFHRKPQCLSSVISVAYRISIKRRILDKIPHVVDKSERSCVYTNCLSNALLLSRGKSGKSRVEKSGFVMFKNGQ